MPGVILRKLRDVFVHQYAAPVLVFVVSLSARLTYLIQQHAQSPFSDYLYLDAFRYDSWACNIAFGTQHAIEPTFRAPLYPVFLAAIHKIFGHHLLTARLVQMLLGALVCVMVYFIALRLFNKRTAIISSLLAAFYGPFLYWSGEILIVNLIVFLDLTMLLILLKAFERPGKLYYWLLGGVVSGLSAIARPNVLLFIPWVLLIILLMSRLKETRVGLRSRLAYLLCFMAGVLAVISPVTISNYFSSRDFVLISSQGGINFYMGNNPDADGRSPQPPGRVTGHGQFLDDAYLASLVLAEEAAGTRLKPSQVSRFWFLEGVKFVTRNPWEEFKLTCRKLAYFWTGMEVTNNEDTYYFTRFSSLLGLLMWHKGLAFPFGLVCPLALVGIVISRKHWRKLLLLYGFVFLYMISVVLFFVCARYRLPVIPVLLIFAGYAIDYSVERFRSRRYKPLVLCGAGAVLIGVLVNIDVGGVTDGSCARACLYGGSAYEAMGKHELAIKEFRKAIELLPENLEASHRLGTVYMETKEYDAAEKMFLKVLAIDPYCATAHFNLGSVCVAQRRYHRALDEYEAALEIDPNYELAACWAGIMHERFDQWEEALEKWQRALQINPNNGQARSKIEMVKHKLKTSIANR